MMQIQKSHEVKDLVKKADGTYQFWVTGEQGVTELRIAFGPNLGLNEDLKTGWIEEFVSELQDKKFIKTKKEFLATVPQEHFLEAFWTSTFTTLTQAWHDKQKGSLEEKTVTGLIWGREYHRSDAVSALRPWNYHCYSP
jgi:hypothetical protein